MKFEWSSIVLLLLPLTLTNGTRVSVKSLDLGETETFVPKYTSIGFRENHLMIYCYPGVNESLSRVFYTVQFQLDIENEDYTQYEGDDPDVVTANYERHNSIFSFNLFSNKRKNRIKLNPFNQTCIGIDSIQPYAVHLSLIRVDFWKVILMAAGLFIFAFSADLSQNAFFYYTSGVILGILTSFMILVYLISKLIPARPVMYGTLIGGWTIGIYFIQLIYENIKLILVTYQWYVTWYACITGVVSFIICYRRGPPTNERSKNLTMWGLQAISLSMVFLSSEFKESVAALIILVLAFYYFPRQWIRFITQFYIRKFPPKVKLLTSEEYFEQGIKETSVALENLRSYCNSPECKQWKVMTKLKNPLRFAEFVEGSSHLNDEEILNYEEKEYLDISEDEGESELEVGDETDSQLNGSARNFISSYGLTRRNAPTFNRFE